MIEIKNIVLREQPLGKYRKAQINSLFAKFRICK